MLLAFPRASWSMVWAQNQGVGHQCHASRREFLLVFLVCILVSDLFGLRVNWHNVMYLQHSCASSSVGMSPPLETVIQLCLALYAIVLHSLRGCSSSIHLWAGPNSIPLLYNSWYVCLRHPHSIRWWSPKPIKLVDILCFRYLPALANHSVLSTLTIVRLLLCFVSLGRCVTATSAACTSARMTSLLSWHLRNCKT